MKKFYNEFKSNIKLSRTANPNGEQIDQSGKYFEPNVVTIGGLPIQLPVKQPDSVYENTIREGGLNYRDL